MIADQVNSSYNSSASSHHENNEDKDTIQAKNYIKDLLKSQIFLGRYIERRLIDQRIGYRDIILISAAETDLKKDLYEVRRKLSISFSNLYRFGFVEATDLGINSSGLCIWTEIENQPFGPFWFQIKSIKFRPGEIMISVKCLRHISDAYLEIEPILTGGRESRKRKETKDVLSNNDSETQETLSESFSDIIATLKTSMSIHNVKEFITFIFAFVIAIFTGSTTFVSFVGNFILALIRELSIFVKNSTPMFLGVIDCFSKIVGGFYILVAMFFKPNNPPPSRRSISHNSRHHQTPVYDYKQFD